MEKLLVFVHSYPRGAGYYELTEQELSERCCIYDALLYWKQDFIGKLDRFDRPFNFNKYYNKESATIEDIWKYEMFHWDEMDKESYTYQVVNKSYQEYLSTINKPKLIENELPKRRKLRKDPSTEKVLIDINSADEKWCGVFEMTIQQVIDECCLYKSKYYSKMVMRKEDAKRKRNKTEFTVETVREIVAKQTQRRNDNSI